MLLGKHIYVILNTIQFLKSSFMLYLNYLNARPALPKYAGKEAIAVMNTLR